jgi:MoaD family protein
MSAPTVHVHISGHLRQLIGSKKEVDVFGVSSVSDLVGKLDEMFPGIKDRVFDDQDKTREFVNIFVNGENIRDREQEKTKLKQEDSVYILPSVAGGSILFVPFSFK